MFYFSQYILALIVSYKIIYLRKHLKKMLDKLGVEVILMSLGLDRFEVIYKICLLMSLGT